MAKKFKLTTKYAAILAIIVIVFVIFFATQGQTAQFRAAMTSAPKTMQVMPLQAPAKLSNLVITSASASGNTYDASVQNKGTDATPAGVPIWVDFSYSAEVNIQTTTKVAGMQGAQMGVTTETKHVGGNVGKCQLPVIKLDSLGTSSCSALFDMKNDIATKQLNLGADSSIAGGTATILVNADPTNLIPESSNGDNMYAFNITL